MDAWLAGEVKAKYRPHRWELDNADDHRMSCQPDPVGHK